MPETMLLAFAGLACLALATHRIRREAGIRSPHAIRALRTAGAILLVAAFALAGTALTGERIVRFLAAAGLAGVAVVLCASLGTARMAGRVQTGRGNERKAARPDVDPG